VKWEAGVPTARPAGIAQRLAEHNLAHVRQALPTVRRLRAVIQHLNKRSIHIHEKQGYRRLHLEAFAMAALDRARLDASVVATPSTHPAMPSNVRLLSGSDFWHCLNSLEEPARSRLLPGNLFLVDWMPYDLSLSNILEMERQGPLQPPPLPLLPPPRQG
jgi:hypothetical protein